MDKNTAGAGLREPARRFAALDGWRGISAVMIVLLHAPIAGWIGSSAFVRHAYLFVDFFFVLSGFVITHAFADRLDAARAGRAFMVSRLKRVYPLHLFMLMLFVVFELAMLALRGPDGAFLGGNDAGALLANLTMMHALGTVDGLGWNYPSWSISAELVAYLAFALLMIFARRTRTILLVAAVVLAPLVLFAKVGHLDTTVEWGWLRCLCGFSLGALLRLAVWPRLRLPEAGTSMSWTLAEAAVVVAVASFVVFAGTTPISIAAPFVFAYAILVFAHEGGAVSRVLKTAPIAFIGLISYSIYMTHAFVISRGINAATAMEALFGMTLMRDLPDGTSVVVGGLGHEIAALVLIVAATIVASALTYYLIERPGQRLSRRSLRSVVRAPASVLRRA